MSEANEVDKKDIYARLDWYNKMSEYYNSICTVRHWKQHTIDAGRWVESQMKVKDAIYSMRERLIERASFKTNDGGES